MRRPELRSPTARAVVPVALGLAFIAVMALVTWGIAAVISASGEREQQLADDTFRMGSAVVNAERVERDGPFLFQGLKGSRGVRSIVVDHQGADPLLGWSVRYAYPADRPAECIVRQVPHTRDFTDCEGRTVGVDDLALPEQGVVPKVDPDAGSLEIDFSFDSSPAGG